VNTQIDEASSVDRLCRLSDCALAAGSRADPMADVETIDEIHGAGSLLSVLKQWALWRSSSSNPVTTAHTNMRS